MNGVKIAVPAGKMSNDDLEYVEAMTGISLQHEKPAGDNRKSRSTGEGRASPDGSAKVEKPSKPEYDWFQFFLDCNVAVGLCERYAQAFHKDSMDESVLPDVDANILRTLGLREGDIIKVMRTLDGKFGRNRPKDNDGGLFSGPGGALRNNTRKGRPAPAVQASDVVDASAFSKKDKPNSGDEEARSPTATSPPSSATGQTKSASAGAGFDDDAWDVKPSKQAAAPSKAQSPPAAKAASPPPAALAGSMQELSLLSEPLQPTKTASPPQIPPQLTGATAASPTQAAPQPMPGATPGFFSSMAQQNSAAAARQRPAPPQPTSPLQGSLVPPPPQRPLSAPQSAQPSAYAAPGLTQQMTGLVQGQVAPPGQSLNDITQQRLHQQYTAMQPQYTGFPSQQAQGMQPPQGMMPYQPGNQGQFMQPMMTGMPQQSPFADPGRSNSVPMQPQQTGYQPPFNPGQQPGFGQPPQGGINNYLPQPLEPQRTAMQPQPTGFGQTPQQQTPQPLLPQQTGPAPPVRFGTQANSLAPQATGRKANLSQASK